MAATVPAAEMSSPSAVRALDYRIEPTTAGRGFDGQTCWVHARAGAIPPHTALNPADTPLVVMTLQKLLLSGSDIFYGLHSMHTSDLGQTWSEPRPQKTLARRREGEDVEAVLANFTPKWHSASATLLGTGDIVRYRGDKILAGRTDEVAWSKYDPSRRVWSDWAILQMPDEPKFKFSTAGCTQRVDLPNGDILLPIYFRRLEAKQYSATVVRCRFDGKTLRYAEHGDELTIAVDRGFGEPSLAQLGGRFYLSLRNDQHGYVTRGDDGLHFAAPRRWTFDDGADLGNYNTQQHWVTHRNGLFLVYTRRGANNDHVFRHRAPLFIAQVDPERLCVIRATERILAPNRGAGLGNFGVADVGPNETWVIASEWMQPKGCEKYGSDNSIFTAKILWNDRRGK
ncbi:exo-alpha-sialidase [Candidatus Sumerlaeota bacterium]|nr:exo-alpha-sialidase [Candidatus Sumerlaeota bacterium]